MKKLLGMLAGMMAIVLLAGVIGYTYPTDRSALTLPTVYSWPRVNPSVAEVVSAAELRGMLTGKGKVVVLDARSAAEFAAGHVGGALNLPPSRFDERYPEMHTDLSDAVLVIYCGTANPGDDERLYELLTARGHQGAKLLSGGWSAWVAAGYPQEGGR